MLRLRDQPPGLPGLSFSIDQQSSGRLRSINVEKILSTTFLAVTLLSLHTRLQAADPVQPLTPPLSDCKEVFVLVNQSGWSSWWLRINHDGSGGIIIGAIDSGSFPKGTIDFASFYKSLVPSLVPTYKRQEIKKGQFYSQVSIIPKSGDSKKAWYTGKSDLIKDTFNKGFAAMDSLLILNRMDYMRLLNPPFSSPRDPTKVFPEFEKPSKWAKVYEQIGIFTAHGWILTINQDGSAKVSYGRNSNFTCELPAGTFDFRATFKELIIQPLRDGENAKNATAKDKINKVAIGLKKKKKDMQLAFYYAPNIKLVRALFDHARKNAPPAKKTPGHFFTIDHFWEKVPPVTVEKKTPAKK